MAFVSAFFSKYLIFFLISDIFSISANPDSVQSLKYFLPSMGLHPRNDFHKRYKTTWIRRSTLNKHIHLSVFKCSLPAKAWDKWGGLNWAGQFRLNVIRKIILFLNTWENFHGRYVSGIVEKEKFWDYKKGKGGLYLRECSETTFHFSGRGKGQIREQ